MNPDIFLVGSHGNDFDYLERETRQLQEKGKKAGWWSFLLQGGQRQLHFPPGDNYTSLVD
jgi:hypothetical protein